MEQPRRAQQTKRNDAQVLIEVALQAYVFEAVKIRKISSYYILLPLVQVSSCC